MSLKAAFAFRKSPGDKPHKIGYVPVENWNGPGHRECEAPRHEGQHLPATAVIALAELRSDGEPDLDNSVVWGACIECLGLIGKDIEGEWKLPGSYSDIL